MNELYMLQFNGAIDSGYGFMLDNFPGEKALVAGAGGICPQNVNRFYVIKQSESNRYRMAENPYTEEPITGELKDFDPIALQLVSGTDWEICMGSIGPRLSLSGLPETLGTPT